MYYDTRIFSNNGSSFNTDLSEGIYSPIYDVNGNFLGTTKEGFTGDVLVYSGNDNIDFSSLTEKEALEYSDMFKYDEVRSLLTGDAKSNIWTSVVSQMEGEQIFDEVFHMSDLYEKTIIYNPQINASWKSYYTLGTRKGKIQGSDQHLYETTIENIQSSIVVHEYYSHIKKNNGDKYKSHRLAYKNVINHKPLWNNTTDSYKGFIVRQLLKYTILETDRSMVDLLYRNLFDKYKNY